MSTLYLTYGDILGNVFGSQLEPLWFELKENNLDLQSFSFVGPTAFFQCSLQQRLQDRGKISPVQMIVSFVGAGFPPKWPGLCESRLKSQIKKINPNVVHARGPISAGLAARAIKTLSNPPKLIYDVRGDTIAEIQDGDLVTVNSKQAVSLVRSYEADALLHASEIFAVSKPLIEMIQEEYSFKGSAKRIPCWARRPNGYQEPSDLLRKKVREELKIPQEAVVWTYCGSAAMWQALPEMFLMFKNLLATIPESFFLILTDDAEGMRSEIEKVKIPSNKIQLLSGRRDEVVHWLISADIAILLREENKINRVACPMKFADYLLAGLPVFISDHVGDLSNWVRQYYAGEVVSSLDPMQLSSKAQELLQSVQKRGSTDVRAHTLSLYREKLALENYIGEYLSSYKT